MENRNSKISAILLLVIVGTSFFSMAASWSPKFWEKWFLPPLEAGLEAPQFELESLAGYKISLKDYEGKPVLLKFWSKG
jgi:cytochrome oxidase Cu insertion factor (SCO1/SenC/PrrC family)